MSFGPGGYEDDWDDDDGFDFGDDDGTDYSTQNFYSSGSENNHFTAQHVSNSSSFTSKVNGQVPHTASQVTQATTKAPSFGRGRGRGGFSTPPKTQNTNVAKKKSNVNKNRQTGQGNFLFARTSEKR